MFNKLISVIIPTYNRADKIEKSINSVLEQTYSNFELIVVDDGSTDNTKEIIDGIKDNRIKYIYQNNAGACAARNRGIAESVGDYIAFHDSDDIWHKDKLEKQMHIVEMADADVVICKANKYQNDNLVAVIPKRIGYGYVSIRDDLFGVGTQTILAKKEIFDEDVFDNDMPRLQDMDWMYRVLKKHKVFCIDEGLVDYVIGADSIVSNSENQYVALKLLKDKYPRIKKDSPAIAMHAAKDLLESGRKKNSFNDKKRFFKLAASYYPGVFCYLLSKKKNETNENKLRIAMLGHKRIPSREGGVEIVVEELSTRMVQRGHSVTCYNRSGHHVSGKEFDANINGKYYKGVRIKKVFTIDKKGLAAMTSSLFASLAVAFRKYDIVHFHAEGPCAVMWIPKLFGKKCVATIHGIDWQRAKWGNFASKYIKYGEKTAVKYADKIIVLSKNMQDYFMKEYGRETVYIPNSSSVQTIREVNLIREKFGLEKNSYVLFVGRIVPEKGITYLIDAWKQISTDKKLVIAGGVSDSTEYTEEIKSLCEGDDSIILTDFVQGEILDELYSNAYVYCIPSDLEGMPLSLMEAMSYGNCCLVSDIKEHLEMVDDKAVAFKKSNVNDLKLKLQELLNDEETVNKYKKESSDYILNKYNWENVVTETLKLYMEIKGG